MNILFVCTANRYRSRTAMEFFRMKYTHMHSEWKFDSCGTNPVYVEETKKWFPDASVLTDQLMWWADVIVCMEESHKVRVDQLISRMPADKPVKVKVLGFGDDFIYMSTDLIRMLNDLKDSLWKGTV